MVRQTRSSTFSVRTAPQCQPSLLQLHRITLWMDQTGGGEGIATGSSAASTGTPHQNSTSTCGSHHHHHHNCMAGANAGGQNGTLSTGHHSHNGTMTNHRNNSTSSAAGSGGCGTSPQWYGRRDNRSCVLHPSNSHSFSSRGGLDVFCSD